MIHRQQGWRLLANLGGAAILVLPILREIGPFGWFPRALELSRFLALMLALGLAAYWAGVAQRAARPAAEAVAAGAAILSLSVGLWTIRYLGTDAAVFLDPTPQAVLAAATSGLLVLVTAWRVTGRALTLVVVGALLLGWAGQFAPDITGIPPARLGNHLIYVTFGSDGIYGVPLDIMVNMVLLFVVFGAAFEVAGGSAIIAALAVRLSARSRGGAVKACVLASGLFGTVSGAVTSNVMTSGSFSIPSMRRTGLSAATAAGIEAAASTGGQIMPPVLGAAAFLLADLVGLPYGEVVLASIGPALIVYLAFFRQADRVVRESSALPPDLSGVEHPRVSWLLYALPPTAIVGVLLQSHTLVGIAAIAGTAVCLPLALLRHGTRGVPGAAAQVFPALIRAVVNLLVVAATVGLLLAAIYASGLTVAGAIWIGRLGEHSLALALILTAGSAFLLGMGVATAGVYILAATLLAPGLVEAGVPPLAAHFFVLYCGILSMITPPVAFASFAAATLASAPFGATSREAMRFGWILFVVPFLIVAQPGLLLLGPWSEIAAAYACTAAFVVLATTVRLPALLGRLGAVLLFVAMTLGAGPVELLALSAAAIGLELTAGRGAWMRLKA